MAVLSGSGASSQGVGRCWELGDILGNVSHSINSLWTRGCYNSPWPGEATRGGTHLGEIQDDAGGQSSRDTTF